MCYPLSCAVAMASFFFPHLVIVEDSVTLLVAFDLTVSLCSFYFLLFIHTLQFPLFNISLLYLAVCIVPKLCDQTICVVCYQSLLADWTLISYSISAAGLGISNLVHTGSGPPRVSSEQADG